MKARKLGMVRVAEPSEIDVNEEGSTTIDISRHQMTNCRPKELAIFQNDSDISN